MQTRAEGPRLVVQIDLDNALPALPERTAAGDVYRKALVLARLHGSPVAVTDLEVTPGVGTPPALVGALLWPRIHAQVNDHLRRDGLPEAAMLPPWQGLGNGANGKGPACTRLPADAPAGSDVTVVVPTLGRSTVLPSLLRGILGGLAAPARVVVAVSDPANRSVEDEVLREFRHDPVTVVRASRPGAALARNAGAAVADTEVVAFLDDDVEVDQAWLLGLLRGFSREPQVTCVTGLIMPAALDAPAQIRLQQFGGFDKGTEPRLFDLDRHALPHPLYPYLPGTFGSGANFAMRRRTFTELGGFDERLGPGTTTRGGEDIDLLMRAVLEGHTLAYEPQALVQHHHRVTDEELRRTVFGYGVGLGAVLLKHAGTPEARREIVRRLPRGMHYLLSPSSPKNARAAGANYPPSLRLAELAGLAAAPLQYARSRGAATPS